MVDQWIGGGVGFPAALLHGVTTPPAGITVSLPGWEAKSSFRTPRDGTWAAKLSKWSGWWGGSSVVVDSIQSPTGDGIIEGPVDLGPLTITLSGTVRSDPRSSDPSALYAAGDSLAGVLKRGVRHGELVVAEGSADRRRVVGVRLAQTSDFELITPWVATWAIYLTAADPLRYGIEETIIRPGQSVRVPNAGNIISRPIVDFVGPLSAPTLRANGGTFTLGADVAAGSTLTADMRQRIVWLNGNRTFTPARGFWQNVPEGGTDYTLGGTGSGYARVRRSSAWT